MRRPRSLLTRLALSLGVLLTTIWIGAATITAIGLRHEIDEVFDSALRETAERILPLAVTDIVSRDTDGVTQRLAALRGHDEHFTYVVRDAGGTVLLQSHAADPAVFPPYDGRGFRETATHRFYNDEAVSGTIRITVAEPLGHRAEVAGEIQMGLGLPLLIVLPVALLAIFLAVRESLGPLRRFRDRLEARTPRDLTPVPALDLPSELAPLAETLNRLFGQLQAAFEAERSFAFNAAHELRTPLAGAIAQVQRLRAETDDPKLKERASGIEATLKRLTGLSERLMQLARAEGGRLRLPEKEDLRPVVRIVADDIGRTPGGPDIRLTLPPDPVLSDLDPDMLAILCRNLIENAHRHGDKGQPVEVRLTQVGTLSVANDGPPVAAEKLARLTPRFERAADDPEGSGLGLAIVSAIAERSGSRLTLSSPRPGQTTGFEARLDLPVAPSPDDSSFERGDHRG